MRNLFPTQKFSILNSLNLLKNKIKNRLRMVKKFVPNEFEV